jgi:hypothetical protein
MEATVSSTGSRPRPRPRTSRRGRAGRPDSAEPASFDHLLQSRQDALDFVPEVSGTYDELMARAVALGIDEHRVWVESVEDLLVTLTVPRRTRDRDRVQQLRSIQRAELRVGRQSA